MFGPGDDEEVGFTINESFAARYQKKKRHEEITDLRRKYGDEADDDYPDSESAEEEDENGELVTPEVDAQIMKTIATIRAGKPEVYDPTKKFFSEDEINAARQQWKEKQIGLKKEGKPFKLKDFHRRELLLEGAARGNGGGEEEEDEDEGFRVKSEGGLTFSEEQARLKDEFKSALKDNEDDEDDEFMSLRVKTEEDKKREEEEYRKFLLENLSSEGGQGLQDFRDYNSIKPQDPDEAFLMEYVLNRGWVDKDAISVPTYEDVVDLSGDEEAVETAEDFERTHNFRFEEEGSTNIVTHARDIEGTLRRKDDKRKKQRDAKKERQEEDKARKAEELKRLKNLKKEEIRKRLEAIRDVAGVGGGNGGSTGVFGLDEVDLEKEFDPEEFDRKMAQAFDDRYYDQNEGDAEKPVFTDDIDISDILPDNGLPKFKEEMMDGGWDESAQNGEEWDGAEEGYEGYEEEWDGQEANQGDDENFIMDADYLPGGEVYGSALKRKSRKDKKKGKRGDDESEEHPAAADGEATKKSLSQYMDEVYQLDYEDMIGDLPTRFKYRQVDQQDYGLTPLEILLADDADLNELVGLKKLAPFRRKELVEQDLAKFSKSRKKRLREFRKKLEAKVAPVLPVKKTEKGKKGMDKGGKKRKQTEGEKGDEKAAASNEVKEAAALVAQQPEEKTPSSKKRKEDNPTATDIPTATTSESKPDAPPAASTSSDANPKKDKKKHKKPRITEDRLASYQMPNKKKK
ncbi:KRI1-like family C-terminal-domain-containing protein [Fimicolochytrium jonesii]|uniref:KRI1-like family C-terminal-domain-containing protein n=1 Tax=Fimicolochytrium jonesii TaxID=1396493 RepID=UPI0022FE0372|nr:KRI1-like family C-terminal-domain-containing protein [Fimicolochytrium jonesii]KAI8817196.1 KRI1-like family C-terminal-domain-containing protein [Fimicolochytrium jonesii]